MILFIFSYWCQYTETLSYNIQFHFKTIKKSSHKMEYTYYIGIDHERKIHKSFGLLSNTSGKIYPLVYQLFSCYSRFVGWGVFTPFIHPPYSPCRFSVLDIASFVFYDSLFTIPHPLTQGWFYCFILAITNH